MPLEPISSVNVIGLTITFVPISAPSLRICRSSGRDGVLVTDGVLVIVGDSVSVSVGVMVGVRVIVGVSVAVGVGTTIE